jgi:hypothetical protein
MVILGKAAPASLEHHLWRGCGLLFQDIQNYDGIRIDSVEDPPGHARISDSQLMAAGTYRRHRARRRHREELTFLQAP